MTHDGVVAVHKRLAPNIQKYIDYYNISYSYLHTVVERARQRFTPEECAKLEQMLTIVSTELMPELDILKKGED